MASKMHGDLITVMGTLRHHLLGTNGCWREVNSNVLLMIHNYSIIIPHNNLRIWGMFTQGLYSQSGRTSTPRSHEDSKPRDSGLFFSICSEIRQAHWQRCCRDVPKISERHNNYNTQYCGFELSIFWPARILDRAYIHLIKWNRLERVSY